METNAVETNAVVHDEVTITLPRGEAIAGTLYQPASGTPRATLVMHPATATPRGFYRAFAQFFASRGMAVLTYDVRGIGGSGDVRTYRYVRMRDWMAEETPATAAWMQSRFPGVAHLAAGHSLGGHAMALGFGVDGLAGFATVASHAGTIARIEDPMERFRVRCFFRVAPTLSKVLGYAPSKVVFGANLPAAAIQDWAPWTRHPRYFFDDPTMRAAERAASVRVPVIGVGVTDDAWASSTQIDALLAGLTNTTVDRRTYAPTDLGRTSVGHHGLMRRGVGERFWADLLTWFEARIAEAEATREDLVSV